MFSRNCRRKASSRPQGFISHLHIDMCKPKKNAAEHCLCYKIELGLSQLLIPWLKKKSTCFNVPQMFLWFSELSSDYSYDEGKNKGRVHSLLVWKHLKLGWMVLLMASFQMSLVYEEICTWTPSYSMLECAEATGPGSPQSISRTGGLQDMEVIAVLCRVHQALVLEEQTLPRLPCLGCPWELP